MVPISWAGKVARANLEPVEMSPIEMFETSRAEVCLSSVHSRGRSDSAVQEFSNEALEELL
jgi:hypothetical protein